ncbi:MAG: EAL domain-containing protein [Lachnospiraceae bacterium]|nr:EAL domain-containing protein [Lachnospiraceae bacterium]
MININFDIASLALVSVLLIYFQGKRTAAMPSTRIYFAILVSLLSTGLLDIFTVIYRMYPAISDRGTMFVVNVLSRDLQLYVITVFSAYLLCISMLEEKLEPMWVSLVYVPYAIAFLMIPVFAFRGYSVGEEPWEFRSHPVLVMILLIFLIYYLIVFIVIGLLYAKMLGAGRTFHVVTVGVILIAIQAYGLFFPDRLAICFLSALCMVEILFTVQKTEDMFEPSDAMKRKFLKRSAEQDMSRNTPFYLVFIKIFDLGVMTEALGQENADQFLKQVTAFLLSLQRNALCFQPDKDVMLVKLRTSTQMDQESILKEIRERFEQPWRVGTIETMLSAAYVTASYPDNIKNIDDLHDIVTHLDRLQLEEGDVISADKLNGDDKDRQILEAIRRALDDDSFQVFYQPIYSTHDKKIIAAEALIRLFDPVYGFIPPEPMIAIAEQEGYILRIGEIVFREVCRFYTENKLDKLGIQYIEVNLSAVQCMHNRLAEQFLDIMHSYNLSSDKINFEITESSAMISNVEVSRNISHFELHGVSLSLDDYGTGYSNISYLYNLPFVFMKIDKSILWGSENNKKADIILRNTFRMAKRLRMKVVMEGVETEEQIKKLLALECDYFQGYYFSRPVKGEEFIEYIKNFELPEVCA